MIFLFGLATGLLGAMLLAWAVWPLYVGTAALRNRETWSQACDRELKRLDAADQRRLERNAQLEEIPSTRRSNDRNVNRW